MRARLSGLLKMIPHKPWSNVHTIPRASPASRPVLSQARLGGQSLKGEGRATSSNSIMEMSFDSCCRAVSY